MRILILEDDPIIGIDLRCIVEGCGHEVVGPCGSLAAARDSLTDGFDFALLDIDLPDGKSFALASRLGDLGIPFAFVSASRPGDLPEPLRQARFIAKPYAQAAIRNALSPERSLAC